MSNEPRWEGYYRKLEGRSARPLLAAVLERFPTDGSFHVVELGSGDGTEATALLERGWTVTAIDAEPAAIARLHARVSVAQRERLTTRVARFEDVDLPAADLILASFSLPFCPPSHFEDVWARVVAALAPGGRFAGEFFGVRDSWATADDMTFHTADEVERLLAPFEVEELKEKEWDGSSGSGPKHWHLFQVIARKR